MQNTVFIGTHIPKTAGSSLIKHFEKEMDSSQINITTSLYQNARNNRCFLEDLSYLDSIRIVFGHHVDEYSLLNFPKKNIYLFTFIRNPIDRIISHYFFDKRLRTFQKREILSFEDFYNGQEKNPICNWLIKRFPSAASNKQNILEQTIDILKCFNFIASTSDFDKKIPIFFDKININNKIEKRNNVTNYGKEKEDILNIYKDRIVSENKDDLELYLKYNENSNDNPFGFDKEKQLLLISNVLKTKSKNQKRKMNYRSAIQEYKDFGVEKEEIENAYKNLENAITKMQIFNNVNKNKLLENKTNLLLKTALSQENQ